MLAYLLACSVARLIACFLPFATYLPTYLPTYLSACLLACITCLLACLAERGCSRGLDLTTMFERLRLPTIPRVTTYTLKCQCTETVITSYFAGFGFVSHDCVQNARNPRRNPERRLPVTNLPSILGNSESIGTAPQVNPKARSPPVLRLLGSKTISFKAFRLFLRAGSSG